MEEWTKGTVTPLASAFPVEEAQKAAKKVEESLETSRKELQKLEEFAQDNRKLVKLVQKLPDKISYNIMVPFGKAAFFPGRMVHTNEFLVLLGEGYYAEHTAKQTVEVLHRRAKVLESKIEGVKAFVEDLHAEASFFINTAAEAAAGVMEIREDYVEKPASKEKLDSGHDSSSAKLDSSASGTAKTNSDHPSPEDKDFDRIMSRLSELEQAEAEENDSSSEQSEEPSSEFGRPNSEDEEEESDDDEGEAQTEVSLKNSMGNQVIPINLRPSTSNDSFEAPRDQVTIKSPADILKFEEWKAKSMEKEHVSRKKVSFQEDPVERVSFQKDVVEPASIIVPKTEKGTFKPLSPVENYERHFPSKSQALKDPLIEHENERKGDSRKAFTGLIVEHGASEVSDSVKEQTSQASESKPSRPVSRFKMQKSNR